MSTISVYVGNYEYEAKQSDLSALVEKFGKVERIDFQRGFCFVHYTDRRDAEDCIKELNRREFGPQNRPLKVEHAKSQSHAPKVVFSTMARDPPKRPSDRGEPNRTLYITGFPLDTRRNDLERAFEEFGRIRRCDVKRSFAFIEFESLDDAMDALNAMNGSKILGREVVVQYVLSKAGEKKREFDDDRWRDRGYDRDSYRQRESSRDRYDARRRPVSYRSRSRSRSRSYDRSRRRRSRSYSRSRSRSPRRTRRVTPPSPRGRFGGGGRARRRSPSDRTRSPPRRYHDPLPPRRDSMRRASSVGYTERSRSRSGSLQEFVLDD